MTYNKNNSIFSKQKKIYFFGIILVCGLLLTSAEDCENHHLMDQELRSREQAAWDEMQRQTSSSRSSQTTSSSQSGQTNQAQGAAGGTSSSQGTVSGTSSASQQGTAGGTSSNPQSSATGSQSSSGSSQTTSSSQSGQTNQAQGAAGGTSSSQGTAIASTPGTQGAGGTGTAGNVPQTASSTGANYLTTISGKTWKLTEVRFPDRTVVLNRNELTGNMSDIFTMIVDNDRISGKGAPNRYFSSYQAGSNNALTIMPVASTMMASLIFDPQRIQEHDFFLYLSKVKSWKINQNRLELTSVDANGKALVMIFTN
ncbi:MAG: META domain-containing protein [Treponema sp.]|nr:META domain-containing protein [Treponema sp.]